MKIKSIIVTGVFCLALSSLGFSQQKGDLRLGTGLTFGSKSKMVEFDDPKFNWGWNITAEYFLNNSVSLNAGYSQFKKNEFIEVTSVGWNRVNYQRSNIDLDLKYYLTQNEIRPYALVGYSLDYANQIRDEEDDMQSNRGFNAGFGIMLKSFNLSAKWHKMAAEGQIVINAGFLIRLNKRAD